MVPLQTERDRVAHLLRRFGFGASEAELSYYVPLGVPGTIKALTTAELDADPVPYEAFETKKNAVKMTGVQAHWILRMACTARPAREKATLFWHDHFATSAAKVTAPRLMRAHVETLREHAFGPFGEMLDAIARDPGMLYWLDNQENVAGKPNENFARELMELFTIGIDGGYTERDVAEVARAFTGWGFRARPSGNRVGQPVSGHQFDQRKHDPGDKVILGRRGRHSPEDVLKMLVEHPRTAKAIVRKAFEWYAYEKPAAEILLPIESAYMASGLRFDALLQAIAASPAFWSERCVRQLVKTPADFVIPVLRQLGLGRTLVDAVKSSQERPVRPIAATMGAMGMNLLFPPDVAGWDHGTSWITSATMIERARFGSRIFGAAPASARVKGMANPNFKFNAANVLDDCRDALEVATRLSAVFDAPLDERTLRAVASPNTPVSNGNVAQVGGSVAQVLFASPGFQFS